MNQPPLPRVDGDNVPFWASARNHALEIQRCGSCGIFRYYPRALCPSCWSEEVLWEPISGRGTIYSWAVVRRAPVPALADLVPYVVALVDLEEGVRVFSRILGADPDHVEIDAKLTIAYERVSDELTLPLFQLADASNVESQ